MEVSNKRVFENWEEIINHFDTIKEIPDEFTTRIECEKISIGGAFIDILTFKKEEVTFPIVCNVTHHWKNGLWLINILTVK